MGSKPPTGPGSRPNPMMPMPPGQMGHPGQAGHMGHPGQAGQMGQMGHPGYPAQMHPSAPTGYPALNQMPNQMANQMSHPGHMSGANVLPTSNYTFGARMQASAAPSRSNALVFVLIAILLAAIGVLAYLVLTK